MRTATLPGIPAFVLLASCLLFAQQPSTTPGSPPQTNAPVPEQPTNPNSPPPSNEPVRPATVQLPTAQPQASEFGQQSTAAPKARQSPKAEAWQVLDAACTGNRTIARAMAIRVLGLMPNDAKALGIVEKALADDKPEVRTAAATALGDMKSRTSIPKFKEVLDDNDPAVALAAGHALDEMHDDSEEGDGEEEQEVTPKEGHERGIPTHRNRGSRHCVLEDLTCFSLKAWQACRSANRRRPPLFA